MNWTLEHKGIKVDMTYAISKQVNGEWTREQVEAEVEKLTHEIDQLTDIDAIKEFNEELHTCLEGDDLLTIDETEVDDYIKWYKTNR